MRNYDFDYAGPGFGAGANRQADDLQREFPNAQVFFTAYGPACLPTITARVGADDVPAFEQRLKALGYNPQDARCY